MAGATVDRVELSGRVEDPPEGYRTRAGRAAPAPRRNLVVYREEPPAGAGRAAASEWGVRVADAAALLAEAGVGGAAARDAAAGDHFYASLNLDIGEGEPRQQPRHLLGRFHLARIKHAFVLYYRTRDGARRCDRLAGEIVDVSVGHPADEAHRAVAADLGGTPYHADYPILSVDRALVRLRSYTPRAFLLDHRTMIHHRDAPFWAVPKLGKRLLRYTAFLAAEAAAGAGGAAAAAAALRAARDGLRALGGGGEGAGAVAAAPLGSGVAAVDAFFAHEREALLLLGAARAERGAADAYRAALLGHLDELVEILAEAAAAPALPARLAHVDGRHLEHADEHYYL